MQLKAFDHAIGDLHDSVAIGNHHVWGDALPPHLQYRRRDEDVESSSADAHAIAADGVAGAGEAMPHADAIQKSFGRHDISHVQAHMGGQARAASRALNAHAYATGTHVAFAEAPSLHTAAHEAAHIVQQQAGVSLTDGIGECGDRYERHADEVADVVVQGKSAEGILDRFASGSSAQGSTAAPIQRDADDGPPADVSKDEASSGKSSKAPTSTSELPKFTVPPPGSGARKMWDHMVPQYEAAIEASPQEQKSSRQACLDAHKSELLLQCVWNERQKQSKELASSIGGQTAEYWASGVSDLEQQAFAAYDAAHAHREALELAFEAKYHMGPYQAPAASDSSQSGSKVAAQDRFDNFKKQGDAALVESAADLADERSLDAAKQKSSQALVFRRAELESTLHTGHSEIREAIDRFSAALDLELALGAARPAGDNVSYTAIADLVDLLESCRRKDEALTTALREDPELLASLSEKPIRDLRLVPADGPPDGAYYHVDIAIRVLRGYPTKAGQAPIWNVIIDLIHSDWLLKNYQWSAGTEAAKVQLSHLLLGRMHGDAEPTQSATPGNKHLFVDLDRKMSSAYVIDLLGCIANEPGERGELGFKFEMTGVLYELFYLRILGSLVLSYSVTDTLDCVFAFDAKLAGSAGFSLRGIVEMGGGFGVGYTGKLIFRNPSSAGRWLFDQLLSIARRAYEETDVELPGFEGQAAGTKPAGESIEQPVEVHEGAVNGQVGGQLELAGNGGNANYGGETKGSHFYKNGQKVAKGATKQSAIHAEAKMPVGAGRTLSGAYDFTNISVQGDYNSANDGDYHNHKFEITLECSQSSLIPGEDKVLEAKLTAMVGDLVARGTTKGEKWVLRLVGNAKAGLHSLIEDCLRKLGGTELGTSKGGGIRFGVMAEVNSVKEGGEYRMQYLRCQTLETRFISAGETTPVGGTKMEAWAKKSEVFSEHLGSETYSYVLQNYAFRWKDTQWAEFVSTHRSELSDLMTNMSDPKQGHLFDPGVAAAFGSNSDKNGPNFDAGIRALERHLDAKAPKLP